MTANPELPASFEQLFALSHYARDVAERWPALIEHTLPTLEQPLDAATVQLALQEQLKHASDEPAQLSALRLFRHQQLVAIAWRDVVADVALEQTLADLSSLAQICIEVALGLASQRLQATFGLPTDGAGDPQYPVVFALGKLGGGELNFSSDIDLIMAFEHSGQSNGKRSIANEVWFAKLVQTLTNLLAKVTADGFCYRVDWRLRPFGEAGRPALSFSAMEHYYQRDGRDWERYAWIKARPVAGDIEAGQRLLSTLRPFIYPRYLDYTAFDALRSMKAMIQAEVERKELLDDIKLGAGGIREIEFVVQAFQLIRGGPDPELRDQRLLPTLSRLGEKKLLSQREVAELADAYRFLRTLENRCQQLADEQRHRWPADETRRQDIATAMGFSDWNTLQSELASHRQVVSERFASVFAEQIEGVDGHWQAVWQQCVDGEQPAQIAPAAAAQLTALARSSRRALGQRGRQRLDQFMPHLLAICAQQPNPETALLNVLTVVSRIATRSAYLALLHERPPILRRLIKLCAASPWLAERLAAQPARLDELIDPRLLTIPSRDEIERAVAHQLQGQEGDLEAEMVALREQKTRVSLTLAAALLDGRAEPSLIAVRLAELATVILQQVFAIAWRDMVARHGEPSSSSARVSPQFAVIGYGSLGSRELNFGSDLDLVFLFDHIDLRGTTVGVKPISNEQFVMRVGQRIVHLLATRTHAGRLYEVDTRLRPNGNSGLLVSSLEGFADYQQNHAWTWELLALTRARFVAGHPGLASRFAEVRKQVLETPRDGTKLNADTVSMRERMRQQLDHGNADQFDLKHGPGGKVDLDFMSQFHRLTANPENNALLASTDTPSGLADDPRLIESYWFYLDQLQRLALKDRPALLDHALCQNARAVVQREWSVVFDLSASDSNP